MTSVSSATSALATLQALSLQATASGQTTAQPTVQASTNLPAATPQDSAVGATPAQSLFAAADGVNQALTAADAAGAAGQTVLGLLQQLREAAGQASDPSTSADDRTQLQHGFQAQAAQIGSALAEATVNGINLLDGSTGAGLKVSLGDGTTTSLSAADLSLGGPTLGLAPGASVATATAASATFASLGDAIGAASGVLSTLRGQADQIDAHAGFVHTLGQVLASPKDDDGDSVRLLALQISQQLAGQNVSVANASPASVLSLFRS